MGNVDWNDPLTLLLREEGEEQECDVLHSFYEAASHCARPEAERMTSDMLGASPFELNWSLQ